MADYQVKQFPAESVSRKVLEHVKNDIHLPHWLRDARVWLSFYVIQNYLDDQNGWKAYQPIALQRYLGTQKFYECDKNWEDVAIIIT